MRRIILKKARATGSTLVMTLVITSVVALSILGYLSLAEQQSFMSTRSQSWNAAMALCEAGVEEALVHLNANYSNLAADGWTYSSSIYYKSNSVFGGNAYAIWMDPTSDPLHPVIISQAYVKIPSLVSQYGAPTFAAVALPDPTMSVARAVRVIAARGSLFIKAMVAKHGINMNGNNIKTDSFDSSDPAYSTGGLYDPAKAKDNGDVATNDQIVNSINVGNANIYGHVATGPGGSVAVGSQGGVGSHGWQATHQGSIETGWFADNSNFTFPDLNLPYTTGLAPTSGDIAESVEQIITNNTTSTTAPNYNPWGGVNTNIVNYTTVTSVPNPPPIGLKTNATATTSSTYPSPAPSLVTTNIASYKTTTTWPSSFNGPIQTNTTGTITSSTYPNPPPPLPYVVTTNLVYQKDKGYPAPGTWVGTMTTNGANYSYWEISGYSWPSLSYTYPLYSYTYNVYSYTYPNFSYTWNLYTTNIIWTTNHYDNILYSGDYYISGALSGKTIILGKAQLVAAGGVSMTGSDVLKIGTGGSVTMYVGGTSLAVGGNGLVNKTGLAQNCIIYALPTVTSLSIGGNGAIIGVICAPNANAQLNGGGSSSTTDLTGALIANTVKMNGHFNFHYDEALGKLNNGGRFLITAWEEIAPR